MNGGTLDKMNPGHVLGMRPFCGCCAGGELRGRIGQYKHTKAHSRAKTKKAKRTSHKIAARLRAEGRPDKFGIDN